MYNLINTESGEIYLGKQEVIGPKSTYDQVKKIKATIFDSIELEYMGIQSLHFNDIENEELIHQISVCFNFGKLSMIFIEFKDASKIIELPIWKTMKHLKQFSNPKKTQMKTKNYSWGNIFASYDAASISANMNLRYKNMMKNITLLAMLFMLSQFFAQQDSIRNPIECGTGRIIKMMEEQKARLSKSQICWKGTLNGKTNISLHYQVQDRIISGYSACTAFSIHYYL